MLLWRCIDGILLQQDMESDCFKIDATCDGHPAGSALHSPEATVRSCMCSIWNIADGGNTYHHFPCDPHT
jgi:hypothetical protein